MKRIEKITAKQLQSYREYKSLPFAPNINKHERIDIDIDNITMPQGFDEAV